MYHSHHKELLAGFSDTASVETYMVASLYE